MRICSKIIFLFLVAYAISYIAYFICGIHIFLNKENEFGVYFNVFEYNIVMMVVTFLGIVIYFPQVLVPFFEEVSFNQSLESMLTTFFMSITMMAGKMFTPKLVIDLSLIIWGCYIMASIRKSSEALDYYNNMPLYVLFQVVFIAKIIKMLPYLYFKFLNFAGFGGGIMPGG